MILVWILIGITVSLSWQAFNNGLLMERLQFHLGSVTAGREYQRLVTSAFVHIDWLHLVLNMVVLYLFSEPVILVYGIVGFLLIYFGAAALCSLLTIYLHRHSWNYTMAGASGAINGIVFALITFAPTMGLGLLFIPVHIPAWLFGFLYIAYSIFAYDRKLGFSAHAGHLGGAIGGVVLAVLLQPELLIHNGWVILLTVGPVAGLMALLHFYPEYLHFDKFVEKKAFQKRDEYREKQRMSQAEELDMLLEKVNSGGLDSLTPPERRRLEELSRKL